MLCAEGLRVLTRFVLTYPDSVLRRLIENLLWDYAEMNGSVMGV